MKPGIIIQARLGSTRLPGKVLRRFSGRTILDVMVETIQSVSEYPLVIATGDTPDNDPIRLWGETNSIQVFSGSETDVLERFIHCARKNQFTHLVRICADNPFLDAPLLETLIGNGERRKDLDYVSFKVTEGLPAIKSHYGIFAEWVKTSALEKVMLVSYDLFNHEHVTNYIYTHPEEFAIEWLTVPEFIRDKTDIRLTIDSIEDFSILEILYNQISSEEANFKLEDLIRVIRMNPKLMNRMKDQIERFSK